MEADDATQNPEIFLQTLDRKPDGFETTDCLECLQILDILIYGRRAWQQYLVATGYKSFI